VAVVAAVVIYTVLAIAYSTSSAESLFVVPLVIVQRVSDDPSDSSEFIFYPSQRLFENATHVLESNTSAEGLGNRVPPKPITSPLYQTGESDCEPVTSIIFVKTHKTASSTLQNIFFRFGTAHNLTFAMPASNQNRFDYPHRFTLDMVKPLDRPINIIANHLRASSKLSKLIPGGKRISIVRSIPSLYESTFNYIPTETFKKAHTFHDFAMSPGDFYDYNSTKDYQHFAKNHLAFDFGFDNKIDNETEIDQLLPQLAKQYDLVLISDYFLESMVLLRKELCWQWDDVLFFVTNARAKSTSTITPEMERSLEKWCLFDYKIFEMFNSTFWEKVKSYPEFDNDMAILEGKLDELADHCIAGERKYFGYSAKKKIRMMNYELSEEGKNDTTCRLMIKQEVKFSSSIFHRQWSDFDHIIGRRRRRRLTRS